MHRLFCLITALCLLVISAAHGLPPDLDYSDRVDGKDLIRLSGAWNSKPGDPDWDARPDLDYSDLVDQRDYDILKTYFGLVGRVRRVWIVQQATNALLRLADDGALIGGFSGLGSPLTVAVDPRNGSVWILDSTQNTVRRTDKDGEVLSIITGFSSPSGLSVNEQTGECWVANRFADRVVRLSPDTPAAYNILTDTGSHISLAGFNKPYGVAVNPTDGACWVADTGAGRVVKIAPDASRIILSLTGFSNPTRVFPYAGDNSLWIETDAQSFTGATPYAIKTNSGGAELRRQYAQGILCLSRLDGSLLVHAEGKKTVIRYNSEGQEIFRAGGFGQVQSAFADPVTGCFWVLDLQKSEVVKLSPGGATLLNVGGFSNKLQAGTVDPGETAGFPRPLVQASASPLSGAEPLEVLFNAVTEDGGAPILHYQWDFDGDGLFDWSSDTTAEVRHTYEQPGRWNPVFRAVNDKGLFGLDTSLLIMVGEPRIVLTAEPSTAAARSTIQFRIQLIGIPQSSLDLILWDMEGDGFYENLVTNPTLLQKELVFEHFYNSEGVYHPTCRVSLKNGFETQASTQVSVVSPAPTVTLQANPVKGYAPLNVLFGAQAQDIDGTIVMYEWDFDGDGVFDWFGLAASSVSHTYKSRAVFEALVRVTDSDGLTATDSVTIDTSENRPPDAIAQAAPLKGNAPLQVALTGLASDLDGTIAKYEWAPEGDAFTWSSPSSGETLHTYTQAGEYAATFRATDNEGAQSSDAVTITVRPSGSPTALPDAAPRTGASPLNVNFTAAGSDPDGTIVLYEWIFERPFEKLFSTWKQPLSDTYNQQDRYGGIAWNQAMNHLYFASDGGKNYPTGIYILDPDTGVSLGRLSEEGVTFGGTPKRNVLAVTPSGRIFHQDSPGDIIMWQNETMAPELVYDDPENDENAQDIAAITTGADTWVYTMHFSSRTVRIFRLNGAVLEQANIFVYGNASVPQARNIAVSPDGGKVYLANSVAIMRWVSASGPSGAYSRDETFVAHSPSADITWVPTGSFTGGGTELVGSIHDGKDWIRFYSESGASSREPLDIPGQYAQFVSAGIAADMTNTRLFYFFGCNGIGCVRFSPAGQWSSPTPGNTNYTYSLWGQYSPLLRVTDNMGLTDEASVDILVQSPPTARIMAPQDGTRDYTNSIVFMGDGSDPDGSIVLYEWDFDNNGTWDWSSPVALPAAWMEKRAGSFTSRFRVTDSQGLQNIATTSFEAINGIPSVTCTADPSWGNSPLSVLLDGQAEDPDGKIVSYSWDFDGDGTFDWHNSEPSGNIAHCDSQLETAKAERLIDGDRSQNGTWQSAYQPEFPVEVVFELKEGRPWDVSRIIMSSYSSVTNYRVKDFEVEVSETGPEEGFTPWIRGQMQNILDDQTFTSVTLPASYVKLRILNTWSSPNYVHLSEFEVFAADRNVLNIPTPGTFRMYESAGIYHPVLKVADHDGNEAQASTQVRVNPAGAPAATIQAVHPSPAWRGEPVLFMGTGKDTGGQVVEWAWDPGGDGAFEISQNQQGTVVSWTSQSSSYKAVNLVDGLTGGSYFWRSLNDIFPQDLVFAPANAAEGSPVTVSAVAVSLDISNQTYAMKGFSVWVSTTAPDSGFTQAGEFKTNLSRDYQVFTFPPAQARWVKVSITSNHGGVYTAAAEIAIFGAPPARGQTAPGSALFTFNTIGRYRAAFRVTDNDGLNDVKTFTLDVLPESLKGGGVWVAGSTANTAACYSLQAGQRWVLSGLTAPWGVAVNEATGECWIANTSGDQVIKMSADGAELFRIAGFDEPQSLAVNPLTGQCWVADRMNHRVVRMSADGTIEASVVGFGLPLQVSVYAADGSCWVSDSLGYKVVKLAGNVPDNYDVSSQTTHHATLADLRAPEGVSVNQSNGTCAVADKNNNRVILVKADAGGLLWSAEGMKSPMYVSVNPKDGSVLVSDSSNNQIVKLSENGEQIWRIGGVSNPHGIAVNHMDGTMWVSDTGTNRLAQISPGGHIMRTTALNGPRAVSVLSEAGRYNPDPAFRVNASASATSGDIPLDVSFSVTHVGGGNIIRYEWDFEGDGVFDFDSPLTGSVSHRYTQPGRYTPVVRVTDANHQVAYDYHLLINAGGFQAVAGASPREGPAILAVTFSHNAVSENPVTKYEWDFNGDGVFDSIATQPGTILYIYQRAGVYTALLRVTDSTLRTAQSSVVITVHPSPPNVGAVRISTYPTPRGTRVFLDARDAFDLDGSIVLYEWDYDGDGVWDWFSKTEKITSVWFEKPGDYSPKFRATDNDGFRSIKSFSVNILNTAPLVSASANPAKGRVPLDVSLSGEAVDYDGTIVLYEWDFNGDGAWDWSSAAGPETTHQYTSPGEFIARLRVTDDLGASAIADAPISLSAAGAPLVTALAAPAEGVAELPVEFDAVVDAPLGPIVHYRWDFGDSPSLDSEGAPTSLLALGHWRSLGSEDVTSEHPGIPGLKPSPGDVYGGRTWTELKPAIAGGFDLRMGSNIRPSFCYAMAWVYSPTEQSVKIKYGIKDSARFWINGVLAETRVHTGSYTPDQYEFQTTLVRGWNRVLASVTRSEFDHRLGWRLTNLSDAPLPLPFSVYNPGDGIPFFESASSAKTTHVYPRAGNYTAALTVKDAEGRTAWDEAVISVYSNPLPQALPRVYPASGPAPLTCLFETRTETESGYIADYYWSLDDGFPDQYFRVPHSFYHTYDTPGVYHPVLEVVDGAGMKARKTLTITVTPREDGKASAWADPVSGHAPLMVNLGGAACAADGVLEQFEWDFDGNGVYDWNSPLNPETTHVYNIPGIYTARMKATDGKGGFSTADVTISVYPAGNPLMTLSASPASGAAPLESDFTAEIVGAEGRKIPVDWDFDGDGVYDLTTTAGDDGKAFASHAYTLPGRYTVQARFRDEGDRQGLAWVTVEASFSLKAWMSRDMFDPTMNQTLEIFTAHTSPARIAITIYDLNGAVVKNLVVPEERAAGTYRDAWDGRDNDGDFVPSGAYRHIVEYDTGKVSGIFDPEQDSILQGVYLPDGLYSSMDMLDYPTWSYPASYNPFEDRPFYLSYTLNRKSECHALVAFYNEDGVPDFFVLANRDPRIKGSYVDEWNGLDSRGRYASLAGQDNLILAIRGWRLPDNAIIVSSIPRITAVSKHPDYLMPGINPYGSREGMSIRYTISKPADVSLRIETDRGVAMRQFFIRHDKAGEQTFQWDGLGEDGLLMIPGYYKIRLEATDDFGNVSKPYYRIFGVIY